MAQLLIVHHTPSPACSDLLDAAQAGLGQPELSQLEVKVSAALSCGPPEVLAADAVLLGTPANIGYMSGAAKHFFDQIYYPCQPDTHHLPFGCFVHGNNDTAGAVRAIRMITEGMSWRWVTDPVTATGPVEAEVRAQVGELAALLGAHALGLVD